MCKIIGIHELSIKVAEPGVILLGFNIVGKREDKAFS